MDANSNNTTAAEGALSTLAQLLGLDSEGKPLDGHCSFFPPRIEKAVTGGHWESPTFDRAGNSIADMNEYSPSVPELTPGSSKDGGSEQNSDISDGVNIDINIKLFEDKCIPFGPSETDILFDMNNFGMNKEEDVVMFDEQQPALNFQWDDVVDHADFDKPFSFDASILRMDAKGGSVSHHANQQTKRCISTLPAPSFDENEKSRSPLGKKELREKDSNQNSQDKHQDYVKPELSAYKPQPGVLSSLEVPENCPRQPSRDDVYPTDAEIENREFSPSCSDCSNGFETDSTWSEDGSDCDEDDLDIYKIYEHIQLFDIGQSRNNVQNLGVSVQPSLTATKKKMVDQIMREFWIIFNQEWTSNIQRHGTGSPESTSSSVSQRHNHDGKESTSSQRPGKRERENEDDDNSKDNSERDRKRPRTDLTSPKGSDSRIKFACPYRKHNPRTYGHQSRRWRSCALSPLDTIARVKGHLYRYHRIFQCPRCKMLHKNSEELEKHTLALKACHVLQRPPAEGITDSIERRLKSRKKTHQSQTQTERWQELYGILFPEEDVPSPYFEPIKDDIVHSPESEELTSFERFSRREVPRFFQTALEVAIAGETHPIVERLKSQLVGMIQECQDRAFAAYKNKRCEEAPRGHSQSPLLEGNGATPQDTGVTEIITRLYERVPPQTLASPQVEAVITEGDSRLSFENPSSDSGYVSETPAPNSNCSKDGHIFLNNSQNQHLSDTQQQIFVDVDETTLHIPHSMGETSIQQINGYEIQEMSFSQFTMDQSYLYQGEIDNFDVDNWLPLDDEYAAWDSTQ